MRIELHPLLPQPARRVNWEENVLLYLQELGELTRGDAQACMEARPKLVDRLYVTRATPHTTAQALLAQEEQEEIES